MQPLIAVTLLLLGAAPPPPKAEPVPFLVPESIPEKAQFPRCGESSDSSLNSSCLPTGKWTAVCQGKRVEGELLKREGKWTVEACGDETPALLFPSSRLPRAPAYVSVSASADAKGLLSLPFGGKTYVLSSGAGEGQSKSGAAGARKPAERWKLLKQIGASPPYDKKLVAFGDLDGDGAPEVLGRAPAPGWNSDYRAEDGEVFALVSLSDPPRLLGTSATQPVRVYTTVDCAELGCDVVAFLDKAETCNHLAGEVSGEAEQDEWLHDAMKPCIKLDKERDRLLRKYAKNAYLRERLSQAWEQ